jgi:bacterioferritin-associated ferredoxin
MEHNIQPEIIDKLTKTCICKGITRFTIKKAIHRGLQTIKEIQELTGAGSGSCCGRRCTAKIDELLKEASYNL